MLTLIQKWVIFGIFCFATLALGGLEVYLIIAIVRDGFTGGELLAGLLSTGLLAGCGVIFLKLVQTNFVEQERVPVKRLHRWAANRSGILREAKRNGQGTLDTRKRLITNTLRFAEETLSGWIPGSHLELCVFVDPEQPLLLAYFDSHNDTVARSMSDREGNPSFYVEKGYEVTKLLREPTSQPQVISDTSDEESGYSFATEQQRKQLRSTLLLCLDLEAPSALVISSNSTDAFSDKDPQLMSFVRFVAEAVKADLLEGDFSGQVRSLEPALFPTTDTPQPEPVNATPAT